MFKLDDFRNLVARAEWQSLLEQSKRFVAAEPDRTEAHLFLAQAFAGLGQDDSAFAAISASDKLDGGNSWSNALRFGLLVKGGHVEEALDFYEDRVVADGDEVDKASFVQIASEHGFFDRAKRVNVTRRVVCGSVPPKYALCLQTFIKGDTLCRVLDSLLTCEATDRFKLFIIQDSYHESMKVSLYKKRAEEVTDILASYLKPLSEKFDSVEVIKNRVNLGTAPTCRRVIDRACKDLPGFIFIEDDCILAPGALSWAEYCLDHLINETDTWFATCESVFFDTKGLVDPTPFIEELRECEHLLIGKYHFLDFVPSTCFMTSSKIWDRCKEVRSFTRGPESLTRFVRTMDIKTISPIMPFASDVGMEHPLGYSAQTLGVDNVKEIKGTYLFASQTPSAEEIKPFEGSFDLLTRATSNMQASYIAALRRAHSQIPSSRQ